MDTTTSGPTMAANDNRNHSTRPHAGDQAARDLLFKTGRVLFIAGLIDIAVAVASMVMQAPAASMVNVFGVVAGWFLMKESLRAAHVVRWIGHFALSAFLVAVLVAPWLAPWDLTLLQLRLQTWPSLLLVHGYGLAGLALMVWVTWRLGRPEVLAARAAAGLKRRDLRIPAALGVAFAVVLIAGVHSGLNGDAARRAEQMAREKFGDGYRYRATHVSTFYSNGVTRHQVMVTVYNDTGYQNVPVQWTEP